VEDRVDAVLHVEVALSLEPVAEDPQGIRVLDQLLVEIEDVAVGVALAEDRDEAEDVALEPESLAVGGDEALARDLGRAVKGRLNREGGVSGVGITSASP
jgi:hypothetical protein